MGDTAYNIGSLPALPADGLQATDLIEIERPNPDPGQPNDNYRMTCAGLLAATASSSQVQLDLSPPAPGWVEQGSIQLQAEYPELFALAGLIADEPAGRTWGPFTPVSGIASGSAGCWVTGRTLLIFGSDAVRRSTDGGQNWDTISMSGNWRTCCRVNDSIVLAAGSYGNQGKIIRSTDSGETWNEVLSDGSGTSFIGFLMHSENRIIVISNSLYGQHKGSSNQGATFNYATLPSSYNQCPVVLDESTAILARSDQNSLPIVVTLNGGQTWSSIQLGGVSLIVKAGLRLSNRIAVLLTTKGIFRTADAGYSWTHVHNENLSTGETTGVSPGTGIAVFILSTGTYMYSNDFGVSWRKFSKSNGSYASATVLSDGTAFAFGNPLLRSLPQYRYDPDTQFRVPRIRGIAPPLRAWIKAAP